MPIDPQKAIGTKLQPLSYEYTDRDVMLYALGIGAGVPETSEQQLQFTYEGNLKVLPTFGVVPPFPALAGLIGAPGVDINPMMILHGEQYLEILKHPVPTSGKLTTEPVIKAIYDKGKGALVLVDAVTSDESGNKVYFNTFTVFVRGEGGFGGEAGPKPGNLPPDRAPDKVVEAKTLPQQALLYRLSGDRNPLHADPGFAGMAGFEKPILHGLCTFGFTGRAVLESFCDNNPEKFKSISVRFASHVFPGETIITEMWKEGNTVIYKAKTKERGLDVISNAAVVLNP